MLICISGKAYSGKDTFAKYLAEALYKKTGLSFIMMAFATELKRKSKEDFDLSYEQLWGSSKEAPDFRYPKEDKNSHFTPREIMQSVGGFYRTIDPNYWINKLFEVVNEKKYTNVIITDVRYKNEANAVKSKGGIVIRINSEEKSKSGTHASEVDLDDYIGFDIEVHNFKDLDYLKKQAIEVAEKIKESY